MTAEKAARTIPVWVVLPAIFAAVVAAHAALGGHGFGIHAGNEERIVADVLAHGALGIEGGRRAVDRVRGCHHFRQLFDGAARVVPYFIEIFGLRELAEQTRHIIGYVGIVQAELAFITIADRLVEERLERMRMHSTSRGR